MYDIKTEDVYEVIKKQQQQHFSSNKGMFDFSNYSTRSKHHDDSTN